MPEYYIKVDGNNITEFVAERMSDIQRRVVAQAYAKAEGISEKGVTVIEKRKNGTHLQSRKEKQNG